MWSRAPIGYVYYWYFEICGPYVIGRLNNLCMTRGCFIYLFYFILLSSQRYPWAYCGESLYSFQSSYRQIHFHIQFHNLWKWQIVVGSTSRQKPPTLEVSAFCNFFHQLQPVTSTSCGIGVARGISLGYFYSFKWDGLSFTLL